MAQEPRQTVNWGILQPNTGSQDLAEDVAKAYEDIDGALLTPWEKIADRLQILTVDEQAEIEERVGTPTEYADATDADVAAYGDIDRVNIMHYHHVPNKVPSADHADAAAKVDNALTITPYSARESAGTPVEFDGSVAKSLDLSASDHTHDPREFEGYHQIYSGTQAPEAGAPDAEVGDIYIRFVS